MALQDAPHKLNRGYGYRVGSDRLHLCHSERLNLLPGLGLDFGYLVRPGVVCSKVILPRSPLPTGLKHPEIFFGCAIAD